MKRINIWLARMIYRLVSWIEKTNGYMADYEYETQPYCGHHYSGHYGKFCSGSYHEGEGYSVAHIKLWRFWLTAYYHSEEKWNCSWMYIRPIYKKPNKEWPIRPVLVCWQYIGHPLFTPKEERDRLKRYYQRHKGLRRSVLGFKFIRTITVGGEDNGIIRTLPSWFVQGITYTEYKNQFIDV